MEPILQAVGVSFADIVTYPPIQIFPHRTTFIRGRSGCGKSTLLKLFNGTLSPSSGSILYRGTDRWLSDTVGHRKKVLLVSQNVFLFDTSIRENFRMFYDYREECPPDEMKMLSFLSICCCPFSPDDLCNSMSGGERQRVYMAICLSMHPDILLLDEPTSALDQDTALAFFQQLKEYCTTTGTTPVVVSHDQGLAESFGEDIIVLGEGERI